MMFIRMIEMYILKDSISLSLFVPLFELVVDWLHGGAFWEELFIFEKISNYFLFHKSWNCRLWFQSIIL